MGNHQRTVSAVLDEITSAIAEVRSVAQLEHDVQRQRAANWLDKQFIDVTDAHTLRSAAADAFSLYGGNGSFSDVGTAESARAVDQLARALRRGRTLFFPAS